VAFILSIKELSELKALNYAIQCLIQNNVQIPAAGFMFSQRGGVEISHTDFLTLYGFPSVSNFISFQ
jgi:hypothetical protein